jgi:hypothetical protein
VYFTASADMVDAQEHRLSLSTTGTDIAAISPEHFILDGLVSFPLPFGVFRMRLSPLMFALLALLAFPVSISHLVFAAPEADRSCLSPVLHPLQRHMLFVSTR